MKTKTKVITSIFVILLSATLAVSVYQVVKDLSQQKKEEDDFAELQELCQITEQPTPETTAEPDVTTEAEPDAAVKHDVTMLRKRNTDCIAWISIPDTEISYPVMHTPSEPQRYLRLNFDRKYSVSGVPFMDYRCTEESTNCIVYGHNMKNGTMFADLISYTDKSFCETHPEILWETGTDSHVYSIYAVATVKKTDSWYNFIDADTEEEFKQQIVTLKSKALYTTDVEPIFGEKILTLSTCYGSEKNGRLIVVAVEK